MHARLRNYPSFAGFGSRDKRIIDARATELMKPDQIATAVRNAKAEHCDPLGRDPSTDVWRLIEYLGIPNVLT